jgi:hypothetical protein
LCLDLVKGKKVETPLLDAVLEKVEAPLLKSYAHLDKHTVPVRHKIKEAVESIVKNVDTIAVYNEVRAVLKTLKEQKQSEETV